MLNFLTGNNGNSYNLKVQAPTEFTVRGFSTWTGPKGSNLVGVLGSLASPVHFAVQRSAKLIRKGETPEPGKELMVEWSTEEDKFDSSGGQHYIYLYFQVEGERKWRPVPRINEWGGGVVMHQPVKSDGTGNHGVVSFGPSITCAFEGCHTEKSPPARLKFYWYNGTGRFASKLAESEPVELTKFWEYTKKEEAEKEEDQSKVEGA